MLATYLGAVSTSRAEEGSVERASPIGRPPQQRFSAVCNLGGQPHRRATIGRLELPLRRGRFVDPPLREAPPRITAYTARGSSDFGDPVTHRRNIRGGARADFNWKSKGASNRQTWGGSQADSVSSCKQARWRSFTVGTFVVSTNYCSLLEGWKGACKQIRAPATRKRNASHPTIRALRR